MNVQNNLEFMYRGYFLKRFRRYPFSYVAIRRLDSEWLIDLLFIHKRDENACKLVTKTIQ